MRFAAKDDCVGRLSPPAALGIGLALFVLHFLALHPQALGQQQNAMENQVKAAYLLNFAKLADWPHHALPDGPSPLVIGVIGAEDEFLNVLKATVGGKMIGTHPVVAQAVSSDAEMKSCQIVFFRASESKHTHFAVEGLAQAGVLSVGEDESFLRQGGMINLVRDHGSVRFEVNSDALDRSEIHFSAKILALARSGTGPSHPLLPKSPVRAARQLQRSPAPEYPEIAARMKLEGTALVEARVRPDGTVKEVRILGGHPVLADALAQAVRLWRYQPASRETLEVVKFSFSPQ